MWFLGLLVVLLFSVRVQGSLLGTCPGRCSPQCYPSCNPVCCYTSQQSPYYLQQQLQQQRGQQQQQFYYQPPVHSVRPPPAQYIEVPPAATSFPAFALPPAPSPAPAAPPKPPPPPPCPADCPKECYPNCSSSCCAPKPPPMPLFLKRRQSVAVACEGHKLKIRCPNKYDRIAVFSTFYGRDDNTTCQHKILPSKGHCVEQEQRINTKLYDLCQGENKCTVAATNSFLAKKNSIICPEVYKYARVVYRCIQHPKIVPVCSLPCHKPYKCFPRCDISCCTPPPPPPPPPPPSPFPPPTCPGACPAKCFPTCSQTCCIPPPPPPPAPVYYPMPPPALPVSPTCPGPCPAICAPACSVRCCITRSTAQQNSFRPLTYSAPRVSPQAYRYRNYYPATQSNNFNNYYNQYSQYGQARAQYQNPYARNQIYGKFYGNRPNNQNVYRYQG